MADKKPICTGANAELGEYSIYETANHARLYIQSEKFGLMNMQGRKFQEKAQLLLSECRECAGETPESEPESMPEKPEVIPENAPETVPEKTEKKRFWLFGG